MAYPSKNPPQSNESQKKSVGKGLFQKCKGCGVVMTAEEMQVGSHVCPDCGYHHPMSVDRWRRLLLDEGHLERFDEHISPADPLQFFDGKSYKERVKAAQAKTSRGEGIECGRGRIDGIAVAYGCFIFQFMGGSMGSVVGERITRMFERATDERIPVVLLHASGGARMQEGILSLMQMAKTVSALRRFRSVRKPFVSICLNPTTGGVAASTAFLGDVNMVEPNALIGFAGPRVIENTLKTKLPDGFQSSEFLLSHGMVDTITPRAEMKQTLSTVLSLLCGRPATSRANGKHTNGGGHTNGGAPAPEAG